MRLNNLIYRTSKLDAQHVAQTFTRKKKAGSEEGGEEIWVSPSNKVKIKIFTGSQGKAANFANQV